VHAAQNEAALQSGVVTGFRWLASADACDICLAIVSRCPAVRLGTDFAVIGKNPTYSHVHYPPAHPHCNCTMTEVLDTDPQPPFHEALIQPKPATDEEIDAVAVQQTELINSIFPPPKKPAAPKPPRKPAAPRGRKPAAEPELIPPPGIEPSVPLAVEPVGVIKPEETADLQEALDLFPLDVRQRLNGAGITFAFAHEAADIDPAWSYLRAPGHKGATYATVGGMFHRKRVLVFKTHKDAVTGETVTTSRPVNALRHETGHAYDEALGTASQKTAFMAAYEADVASMTANHPGVLGRYAYYLQESPAGPEEVFAELFGQLHGGGSEYVNLMRWFPSCTDVLKGLLKR